MDVLVGNGVVGTLTEVALERQVEGDLALELGANGNAHAERVLHLLLGGHCSETEEGGEDGADGDEWGRVAQVGWVKYAVGVGRSGWSFWGVVAET